MIETEGFRIFVVIFVIRGAGGSIAYRHCSRFYDDPAGQQAGLT
jgi:hypothetical protein